MTQHTQSDGEHTVEDLAERVEELETEATDAKNLARRTQQKLNDVRKREKERERRIDDLEAELEATKQEVSELRDRTGLLETVKSGASMKIDERAAVLIQTLYNKAWKRKQKDANTNPTASMDYNAAEAALGGSVARSTILRTFDKAEQLVGDDDVVEKVSEDRSSKKNTRLLLDLSGGDVPATIAGQRISQPEVART